jgi:hypothetical protein
MAIQPGFSLYLLPNCKPTERGRIPGVQLVGIFISKVNNDGLGFTEWRVGVAPGDSYVERSEGFAQRLRDVRLLHSIPVPNFTL